MKHIKNRKLNQTGLLEPRIKRFLKTRKANEKAFTTSFVSECLTTITGV
ncbi:hypothetical protein [Algoriphagus sp. CAU 1675]|nr:hypothetical protein [Algoriphagus sp. CAU 1675]MDF2159432.1 hypothetical protein [Algoriphagus sp. CAU 1675]